jgi:hypothetical protein
VSAEPAAPDPDELDEHEAEGSGAVSGLAPVEAVVVVGVGLVVVAGSVLVELGVDEVVVVVVLGSEL